MTGGSLSGLGTSKKRLISASESFSNVSGVINPTSFTALFFASAVSILLFAMNSPLTKLNLSHVHLGTSVDSPCNNEFLDDVLLDGLNDTVFFDVTNFSKYEYLTFRVSFIAEEVMWSQSPLIAIPS